MPSEKLTARNFHHSAAGKGNARCSNDQPTAVNSRRDYPWTLFLFSGAANIGRGLCNARTKSM